MEQESRIHAYPPIRLKFCARKIEEKFLSETFKLVRCLIRKVDTRMRNVESIC
jgi:hypothetical protein